MTFDRIDTARNLRRNQTEAEKRLWARLRNRQLCRAKFRRQHAIGYFYADFVCIEARLIVELDGGQHGLQSDRDRMRTDFLEREGFRVIRFWNNDVMSNMEGVLMRIEELLCPLIPTLLSGGEKGLKCTLSLAGRRPLALPLPSGERVGVRGNILF
jgi:very-short-patch-repair endonuclease